MRTGCKEHSVSVRWHASTACADKVHVNNVPEPQSYCCRRVAITRIQLTDHGLLCLWNSQAYHCIALHHKHSPEAPAEALQSHLRCKLSNLSLSHFLGILLHIHECHHCLDALLYHRSSYTSYNHSRGGSLLRRLVTSCLPFFELLLPIWYCQGQACC